MKKSITKLALNQETIRTLADVAATRFTGEAPPPDCWMTRLISGCSSGIHADSLRQAL